MQQIKVGFISLGGRGSGLLKHIVLAQGEIVTAVCDLYEDRAEKYQQEYEHPVWKSFLEDGVRGGHGGMDWLVFEDFFNALRKDAPMPIEAYDAATWMAVTALSEKSIAKGGEVVEFPDFTGGKWKEN